MQFEQIPGLKEIKDSLISSYQRNHIAHAQMFAGIEGGGGLAMSLAFTTFLLCTNKQETDSCGKCVNCQKMDKLIHPDVHFYYPKTSSAKSSEYDRQVSDSLKKWREFMTSKPYGTLSEWVDFADYENKQVLISKEDSRRIIKAVSMKSFEGDFKILIIWYPELMHTAAANGILKVLEEPPTKTIYLLVTHDYEQILTTIKSRTQLFSIPPFKVESIENHLIETGLDEQKAHKLSQLAHGSLGKAINESEHSNELAYQNFQDWMRVCFARNYSEMVKLSEDFNKKPKPEQRSELDFSLTLLRESLLSKADPSLIRREGPEASFIKKFSDTISHQALEQLYKLISDSLQNLARNSSPKITHMNLSLNCSQIISR